MPYVMRCLGFAGDFPCDTVGHYFKEFDPKALGGVGDAVWTPNPTEAARFPDPAAVFKMYNAVPKCHPVRTTDGKPNKPMTAYHIVVEAIE